MSAPRLYTAEAGQIVRLHPCGVHQPIPLDMAIGLRDAHRRLCARTSPHLPPSAVAAAELDAAIQAVTNQSTQSGGADQ